MSILYNCSHINFYCISNFRVFRGSLPSGNSVVAFMDTYLVAYDISNPKRLRKVASTCEDFGLRRQFSVFVCRLTATDLVRLKSRLYEIIDLDVDQVIFVPLCARCSEQIEALGRPTEPPNARDVVIVS
jgi:CRISPR-associated protein Cas2